MATLFTECPSCRREAQVQVVQSIGFDNALQWSEGTKCPSCGYTVEADDTGFPPPNYRDAILKDEGVWSILVSNTSERVPFAKVIRKELSLSLRDAMAISQSVPGVVWSGTECEVDWLRNALTTSRVDSVKEKCSETSCRTLYNPQSRP